MDSPSLPPLAAVSMSLFFRQQILDNCRLLFPTEPNVTVITSPTGDYIVSLLVPTNPKILIDSPNDNPELPDLYGLYTKTQQLVGELMAGMKSSIPRRVHFSPNKNYTPTSSTASSTTTPTKVGFVLNHQQLPFPRIPAATAAGGLHQMYVLPGRGGKNTCCAHERERRRKAEKRVLVLEERITMAKRELEAQIDAKAGMGGYVDASDVVAALDGVDVLLEETSSEEGEGGEEEEGGVKQERKEGKRKRKAAVKKVLMDEFKTWERKQLSGGGGKQKKKEKKRPVEEKTKQGRRG
ncbi:hypothetical protein K440DRAFT_277058 [Wilcoxina mikolae CBS 423.85]|nr:hypothetical protein K440DRAFT_277058 [Wilcoxina mikolae CBS 423.85]